MIWSWRDFFVLFSDESHTLKKRKMKKRCKVFKVMCSILPWQAFLNAFETL